MLVKTNGNTLYVDMTVIAKYNLTEDTVNCCYKPFWRQELTLKQFQDNPKAADTTIRYNFHIFCFLFSTILDKTFSCVNKVRTFNNSKLKPTKKGYKSSSMIKIPENICFIKIILKIKF